MHHNRQLSGRRLQTFGSHEFIPAHDCNIIRVETLNGKFSYPVSNHTTGESYNLEPPNIYASNPGEKTGNRSEPEPFSTPQGIMKDVDGND